MNKPFLSIVFIWLLIAGLIAFSAHSCSTAPKPVIQDAPAERVKPIAERITEPEAPQVAKPVHRHVAAAKRETAEEIINLCKDEYVGKDTEEDCAYNRGIDDCITSTREKYVK